MERRKRWALVSALVLCLAIGFGAGWFGRKSFEPGERVRPLPVEATPIHPSDVIVGSMFTRELLPGGPKNSSKESVEALWGIDEGKRFVGHHILELKPYLDEVQYIEKLTTNTITLVWYRSTQDYGKALNVRVNTHSGQIEGVYPYNPD